MHLGLWSAPRTSFSFRSHPSIQQTRKSYIIYVIIYSRKMFCVETISKRLVFLIQQLCTPFSAEHGNIVGWFPHCQLIKIPHSFVVVGLAVPGTLPKQSDTYMDWLGCLAYYMHSKYGRVRRIRTYQPSHHLPALVLFIVKSLHIVLSGWGYF